MRSANLLNRNLGILLLGASLSALSAAACIGGDDGAGKSGAGCPDDLAFFEANVWKPILSQKCAVCHSEGGLAGGSRMVLQPASADGYLEANFEAVKSVASIDVDGTSLLLLKPTGRHPDGHTGGTLVEFNGSDYEVLSTFVSRVTAGKGCNAPAASCATGAPGPRMLRRLSRSEYDATVRDLFGIESTWGASLTADTVVNGFDNNASALRISPLLADQLRRAAEEIAAAVMASPSSILPCDPAAGGEPECAAALIESLGKRAFRRPLTDGDRARYAALHEAVAAEEGFEKGVETVIGAMLQSPHFLYRLELGEDAPQADGSVRLTHYEIASELSYFIWGSMPDAALFAAAESGALATPEGIEAEARRLLADPRSEAMLERFTEQWLEIDRLSSVPKDSETFPAFNEALRSAMGAETRRFVSHVVREGQGTLPEILTAKYSFASPELAAFYAVPAGAAGADGLAEIDLAGTPRAGILTQGSVLTTHSKPNASSPIHRGKLVRERLLCQKLPPPPPGLNVQPPPVDPSKTTRERYAAHAAVEPCVSCHQLIDPVGFGFEHFDGIGQFREAEGGQPVDASGEIVATESTDGAFDGTEELATKLAASPDVHACFALQWFRFAYGVEENGALSCLVDQVATEFSGGELKVEDLIVALTRTPHFTQRRVDGSEGTGSGEGEGGGAATGTSSGGDPGPSTGSGSPGPTGDLAVETVVDSTWAGGSCSSVHVTNNGSGTVTWSILLDVGGSLTDVWNAISEPAGAQTRFTGVDWNASLDAGATASFGFCMTN